MKSILFGLILASVNFIPSAPIEYVANQIPSYEVVQAEVSAYTSSEDETDDTPFLTASGTTTRHGIIACPSRLKFGTKVEIEGRIYTCEDRMNKRYRDREVYDVWMPTKEVAYEWGRKTLEVKIHD